jgi:hypothetical protein
VPGVSATAESISTVRHRERHERLSCAARETEPREAARQEAIPWERAVFGCDEPGKAMAAAYSHGAGENTPDMRPYRRMEAEPLGSRGAYWKAGNRPPVRRTGHRFQRPECLLGAAMARGDAQMRRT